MSKENIPVLSVSQGLIKGKLVDNWYLAYLGIPYADPPLNELRFKAPQAPQIWSGIYNANEKKPGAIGIDIFNPNEIVGSENCLYLDVYTTKLDNNAKVPRKPVIVFINTVVTSKDLFGPEEIIKNGTVFVNLSIRTGIFGFLSLNNTSFNIPGNAGLKDIIQALTWIGDNISKFGGDPNNITLMGFGYGAVYAHLLTVVSKANRLFHKVIAISGSALVPWGFYKNENEIIARQCDNTNVNNENEWFPKLKIMPAGQIIRRFNEYQTGLEPILGSPVIELSDSNDAIFLEDPITVLMSGCGFLPRPILMGFSSMEGLITETGQISLSLKPIVNSIKYNLYVPNEWKIPKGLAINKEIGTEIKRFYYGDDDPSYENIDIYHKMISDIFFVRGIEKTARSSLRYSNAPLYFFQLSFEGKWNLFKNEYHIKYPGACYGDIIGYLFNYHGKPGVEADTLELKTQHRLVTTVTNFAKYSNPNNRNEHAQITLEWKPFTRKDHFYLDMGNDLQLCRDIDRRTSVFWENLKEKVMKMLNIYSFVK